MKTNRRKKKPLSLVQKIILGIIVISSLLVIFYVIFAVLNSPERTTKAKISELASNYYENYLYEEMNKAGNEKPSETLKEYEKIGLSIVYLRQILYYKDQSDTETVDYLLEHCDENKTTIKFYPESPFSKSSYRAEYVYSCDF